MELQQLAFVLEYVDTSINDTSLLAAYDRLIAALAAVAAGDTAALPSVHTARDAWIAVQRDLEPVNWSPAQLAILETYGARTLFGELAVGRLLNAFVVHFMDAKGVLHSAEALLAETQTVAAQIQQLLKGLDPILTAEPPTVSVEGELVENGIPVVQASNGVMGSLRKRLNLPAKVDTERLPAKPSIPLATKVAAAAPLIIAAAGKAVELYRAYNELRSPSVPNTSSHPIKTPDSAPSTVNNYVSYTTYQQTTVVVENRK